MPSAQVFISYRRDDSAGYARAIGAELAQRFGADRVFMDVDDIAAGQGFAEVIQRAVGSAGVLLVLIGRRWRGEREGGAPRLSDPGDFVRLEIAAGLRRGLRVIPVLLDGAAMPTAAEMPADIQALAGLQAIELGNTRFAADIERLVATLAGTLGAPARPGRRRWGLVAGAGLLLAVAAVGWVAHRTRPAVNGEWQGELHYAWAGTPRVEHFKFDGQGQALSGSASFLGVPRGVLAGQVDSDGLRFDTRTSEMGGPDLLHHYRGQLVGDEIRFVMQTEGGSAPNEPVAFTARRVAAEPPR
ncbi:toll/interleukin-1 receptor domain-containing protein [Ideonella sp.]|uniref:toll/interleukin-1 receptor domain-containing protein n=1 Tax=Ideonella sp. TaxID=1929293 RepID=UPI0035B2B074